MKDVPTQNLEHFSMFLEIITPETMLFSGEVRLVEVPGTKGPFVMLNRHAPILSLLVKGTLRIVEESGRERNFEVAGGVVENKENKIVALVQLPSES